MLHTRFLNLLAKKMAGEAAAEELHELEALMKTHLDWAYQAEQIQNLWQLKNGNSVKESELAFEQHIKKMESSGVSLSDGTSSKIFPSTNNNRKKAFLFASASVALLVITALFWFRLRHTVDEPLPSKKFSEISSPVGSKTKLILPDSSVVWLNAGSKLSYDEHFGLANRNISLAGEAFFDVKHSAVPFIISANGVHIKDLGTAFNVKAYPDEKTTETSLIRGKVEITLDKRPGELYILKPDEKLIVANEPEKIKVKPSEKKEPIAVVGNLTHTDDSTVMETSWVENKLVFQDESFADVAKKMERWYGVTIHFTDETVANYQVYGSFTKETIREALDALKIGFHFEYKIEGNDITIAQQ